MKKIGVAGALLLLSCSHSIYAQDESIEPINLSAYAALEIVDVTQESIRFSWDLVDEAFAYIVMRDGVKKATAGTSTDWFYDPRVEENTTYHYEVIAWTMNGKYTIAASSITTGSSGISPATDPYIIETTTSSIKFGWTPSKNAAGHFIKRDGKQIAIVGVSTSWYIDSRAEADTTYQYEIIAFGPEGKEGLATQISATTESLPVNAVTGLNVSEFSHESVTLNWTDSHSAESYIVKRDGQQVATLGSGVMQYIDSDVIAETSYRYDIIAVDAKGKQSEPATVSATTDSLPVNAVTGLNVSEFSHESVTLNWTDSHSAESYIVKRDGQQVATLAAGTMQYIDSDVLAETSYRYDIIAVNAKGKQSEPATVSATTAPAQTSLLEEAIRTGNAMLVDDPNIFIDTLLEEFEAERFKYDGIKRQLFNLNEDGTAKEDGSSLTSIDWDAHHDAARISSSFGINGDTLLSTKGSAFAVMADNDTGRSLVMGAHPFRVWYSDYGLVSEEMHQFMRNTITWLTGKDEGTLGNVVIAEMANEGWFRDDPATRKWLDDNYGEQLSYNAENACDDSALEACLAQKPDLLIISQKPRNSGYEEEVVRVVKQAAANGTPVLYLHYDGGQTELGKGLFDLFDVRYLADNRGGTGTENVRGFDGSATLGQLPSQIEKYNQLLTHFKTGEYSFDISDCEKDCGNIAEYQSEFYSPANSISAILRKLEHSKTDLFTLPGMRVEKVLTLIGDHYRTEASFPMGISITPTADYLKAYYADFTHYITRDYNPVPKDLGNFSRTDFSHITPINKTVSMLSKMNFAALGVYAIPGQTIRVTRTDNGPTKTSIFVNTLRSGATKEWGTNSYTRPKWTRSQNMSIESGETLTFTSAIGGPIQSTFNTFDEDVTFEFENIGEHPYWNGQEDTERFYQQIAAAEFDWVEVATPNFEVHSRFSKYLGTLNYGTIEEITADTTTYARNYLLLLAGYQGVGIERVSEIHDFADTNGWDIDIYEHSMHMNADQATCGAGCSGNPYDAGWDFSVVGHGDLHEISHSHEGRMLGFTGWGSHSRTNAYSFYSRSRFIVDKGRVASLHGQPWEAEFNNIQAAHLSGDPIAYFENLGTIVKHELVQAQMVISAQANGVVEDGWNFYARLHIANSNFKRAIANEELWLSLRDRLGFTEYSWADAKAASNNDRNAIYMAISSGRDFRDFLTMYGIRVSEKASQQIASLNFEPIPQTYYAVNGSDWMYGLDLVIPLPIDGESVWPEERQFPALPVIKPPVEEGELPNLPIIEDPSQQYDTRNVEFSCSANSGIDITDNAAVIKAMSTGSVYIRFRADANGKEMNLLTFSNNDVDKGNLSVTLNAANNALLVNAMQSGSQQMKLTAAGQWQDGQWHDLVWVADQLKGTRLYIDGVEQAQTLARSFFSDAINSERLNIGQPDSQGNMCFEGNIERVSFFNNVLSADDIARISDVPVADYVFDTAPVVNIATTMLRSSLNSSANSRSVSFDARGTQLTEGRDALTYEWSLSDGTFAQGEQFEHTFSQAGNYYVTLKVTDSDGYLGSLTKRVPVLSSTMPGTRTSSGYPDRNKVINDADSVGENYIAIGDSITELWSWGSPDDRNGGSIVRGFPVWEQYFGSENTEGRVSANFGISGDRTQWMLWRLEENFAGYNPEDISLMIGINNYKSNGVVDTLDGISAVVARLRQLQPQARIHLHGLLPSTQVASKWTVVMINEALNRLAQGDDKVKFVDYGPEFVENGDMLNGAISSSIMYDGLHLTTAGYEIWGERLNADLLNADLKLESSFDAKKGTIAEQGFTHTLGGEGVITEEVIDGEPVTLFNGDGGLTYARMSFDTDLITRTFYNDWSYSITAKVTGESLSFYLGTTGMRFLPWLKVNSAGDLIVTLEGGDTHTLVESTGSAAFHKFEMRYEAKTREAGFYFDGKFIDKWSGTSSSHTGVYVGKVTSSKRGQLALKALNLSVGDGKSNMFTKVDVFQHDQEGVNGSKYYRIPSLIKAQDNALLAFIEGRPSSADPGAAGIIKMEMKRSTDNGATWGETLVLHETVGVDYSDPRAILDEETGDIIIMYTQWDDRCAQNGNCAKPGGPNYLVSRRSCDNGQTWEEAIVHQDVKDPTWHSINSGPGIGIQLNWQDNQGLNGRLIFPNIVRAPLDPANPNANIRYYTGSVYSDDHGETWSLGELAPISGPTESEIVELEDGQLMISARNDGNEVSGARVWLRSSDGGISWSRDSSITGINITKVDTSLVRYHAVKDGDARNQLIFSGPKGSGRNNLALWTSLDEGKTYSDPYILASGHAGYSAAIKLANDGLGILYEGDSGISFIGLTAQEVADMNSKLK
ncbi:ImpA family metalloprotease [Shewanella eurypsychrophilus]|uniref:exo-alpha-sialidase n=1 Tax=Shewanella eurypsychrophilus TaxID=2593656 RepID=A0ABX6VHS3_9GAMM|nr:ImpA family metalloprotease [Shewanella eurypsychrophilus]QPG59731.2 ImpA family metalloprotease [Shewanella eurypsychrophilus]